MTEVISLKEKLLEYCNTLHLDAVGITNFPLGKEYLSHVTSEPPCPFTAGVGEERLHGGADINTLSRAIVVLFPYYVNLQDLPLSTKVKPNLARYTWGEDYHLVVRYYLEKIVSFLEKEVPHSTHEIHVDTSPLSDRLLAYNAGLGFYGKNHCFIHPKWGSYVSIGSILTSIALPSDKPLNQHCLQCNACINACPGQSIQKERFQFETCKSYLTQKKGDLTEKECSIITKTPLIFGCDVCQEVCPHNKNLPTTPIKEFKRIIPYIDPAELKSMTNRQFKETYGNRAFSWRGKAILLRNDTIVKKAYTREDNKNTYKK